MVDDFFAGIEIFGACVGKSADTDLAKAPADSFELTIGSAPFVRFHLIDPLFTDFVLQRQQLLPLFPAMNLILVCSGNGAKLPYLAAVAICFTVSSTIGGLTLENPCGGHGFQYWGRDPR